LFQFHVEVATRTQHRCETLKGQHKVRESKQPQDCNEKKCANPTATNETKPKRLKPQNLLHK